MSVPPCQKDQQLVIECSGGKLKGAETLGWKRCWAMIYDVKDLSSPGGISDAFQGDNWYKNAELL